MMQEQGPVIEEEGDIVKKVTTQQNLAHIGELLERVWKAKGGK